LVQEFEQSTERAWRLSEAETARQERLLFMRLFEPASIERSLTARQQAENFIARLYDQLRPLGGMNFHGSTAPYKAAADKRNILAQLLRRTFESNRPVYQRLDFAWDEIPWFGGEERQIPKKILCTYFPSQTLPIFKTEHLEHFVQFLGLRSLRDEEAQQRFGVSYGDRLTHGQKWEVLSEVLLGEKRLHPLLQSGDDDSVYYMYCLYFTSARPPGF
jgi:hypothetical protein